MSQFPTSGPSGRRAYSFADHAGRGDDFGGAMVFKPESGVQLRGPAYGDGAVTTVRFSPVRQPDGRPTPYRNSSAPNQHGDWIRAYYAMRNVGEPRVTFLVHNPYSDHQDHAASPGAVLEAAIQQAVKSGQDRGGWARLVTYVAGQGKPLSKPAKLYMAFGTIWQHKNKIYQPPFGFAADNPPLVIGMSSQCGEAFLNMSNAVNPNYTGPEGHWEQQMACGDLISFDSGRFVTFYTLKDGDPRARQPQQGSAWVTGSSQGPNQNAVGYGCYAEPLFQGQSAVVPESHREYLLGKTRPWDDILYFPSIAEQAAILASRFPPDIIMYGWRNHPEWIPDSVKAAARGVHSVNVGAGWNPMTHATPPPGYAAPAAAAPYGAPPPQQPYGAPPAYGAPQQPPQAYGAATPPPLPQYGAPPSAPPHGAPPPVPGGWGDPNQVAPPQQPAAPVVDPMLPRGGIPPMMPPAGLPAMPPPGLPAALQQPPAGAAGLPPMPPPPQGLPPLPPGPPPLPPGPPPGWGAQATPSLPPQPPPAAPASAAPPPPQMPPAQGWGTPAAGPSPAPLPPVPVPTAPPPPAAPPAAPQAIQQPADGFMPQLPPQPPPPLPGNFPATGRGALAAALAGNPQQRPPGQ